MIASWFVVALAEEPPPADPRLAELTAWLREGGAPEGEAAEIAGKMIAAEDSIPWQTGSVALRDGAITLALGDGDRYAPPDAASFVLEMWGNPPDPDQDGLVLPAGSHLFGPDSWAVLVRFSEDGWVDDSDAASIDYDELLVGMQEATEAGNTERRELGLDALHLDRWAEPPRYEAATHVLYWATILRSRAADGADTGATLNYDVRVLGRRGVLSLNALAEVEDLPRIRVAMERIRGLATFTDGHRYADYVPGVDAKAAYGLAALVAGGAVAAKSGVLKGLIAMLLASKKLLIAGAVGLLALLRVVFGRRSEGRG